MTQGSKTRSRSRGSIKALPSGSLRVRVYAGPDALTGRPHYLTETVSAGPRAATEAEKVRTRLLNEVDEQRSPKTRATLNQLLDAYLEVVDVEPTTKARYELDIRLRLRPALGKLPLSQIQADTLDRYYAQLRRCRDRCRGKGGHVKHRTTKQHECDAECVPIDCRPLSSSSIRSLHWVLNSAFKMAIRWRWVTQNPLDAVDPPSASQPNPRPPSPADAARLLDEAAKDPDWGALVWTAILTGARRGELCAIQRRDIDLEAGVLSIAHSMKLIDKTWVRRDTKTHQHRRIALDDDTVTVLREYMERVDARAALLEIDVERDAYLFTLSPDGSTPLIPDTVTQRYDRMAKRLGINTTFHKLRHYSVISPA